MLCSCKHTYYIYSSYSLCVLRSDVRPSARCFTAEPFPFQRTAMQLFTFHFTVEVGATHRPLFLHPVWVCCRVICGTRRTVCYQVVVSKASFQPLPPQIVSQPRIVISPFSPSSFHSSALCYVVSPDTPFLSLRSWLLLMLLRKSLPPDGYKSLLLDLLVQSASLLNQLYAPCL